MRQLVPSVRSVDGPVELEEAYRWPPGRSVRANFVTSMDGAVEIGGRSRALGGPADRAAFLALRAVSDVVLVGAGTVRAEHYGPVKLDTDVQDRRHERGQALLPRLAIVSNRGDLDISTSLWASEPPPILLTTDWARAERPELDRLAELIVCGGVEVDLSGAMDALAARGLERVLCEGGPTLFVTMMATDQIDELCLTISPMLVGAGLRRLTDGWPFDGPAGFRLEALLEGDGMLLTRYARVRAE